MKECKKRQERKRKEDRNWANKGGKGAGKGTENRAGKRAKRRAEGWEGVNRGRKDKRRSKKAMCDLLVASWP